VQLGQTRAQDFVHTFLKFAGDNVNAQKALCKLKTGVDIGPPRLPFKEISKEDLQSMKTELEAIGFFNWA